ncbi:CHRD domain-containing protein [Occultella gossypii]|uniref:CHRD domain-containing protein n=1 Tax=Occultella gossypii TaxID=2800820 RepID=A0ABS7SDG5_9MICO|nr:CHRD domain-containing protein [Occultella gossypii]MBZ2198379.1 CHRD domain-containing protein [Occultella gossypii]
MKRQLVSLLSVAALGASTIAFAFPAVAADGGRPILVELTGAAERPGPGDPDGTGMASFQVNPGQGRVCYTLSVENIDAATAAHIHVAGTDVPGPVVVPLAAPTDGSSSGCADVSRELAKDLVQHPEDYYVNVHNVLFPGGAVRGQLG